MFLSIRLIGAAASRATEASLPHLATYRKSPRAEVASRDLTLHLSRVTRLTRVIRHLTTDQGVDEIHDSICGIHVKIIAWISSSAKSSSG